ncbi:MAG TPA: diacylglycerol kinase family protein [Pyrinomonadaceae bacterium]|nr:diacylglycerol kinase family protein [Pyrinomonadaceae bacterium]
MSLPLVIVNPASASGSTGDAWPKIASELASHFGAFQPTFTKAAGEAIEVAAKAAKNGRLIIACGGDGTISEVANGILLAGSDAELGILPSGTGGDFRKTLGIPARVRDAAKILREGRTRKIDVGRVTYSNDDGNLESRYFLGVASFGMSADVIGRVKQGSPDWLPSKGPRWLTGRIAFTAAMAETALKNAATKVIVQLDEHPEQRMTVANLCVANARYFGGGMKIAPEAKLVDGEFDVISVGDLGAARILGNAPRLYTGSHLGIDDIGHAFARKVTARPVSDVRRIEIEVDGELPGYLPATFQIVPEALRVRCPQNS